MSDSEDDNAFEEVSSFKKLGNSCFGSNSVTAIKYYTDGISHSIYKQSNANYTISERLLRLRQALLLNRAKCYFKQEEYESALNDANQCINTMKNSKLSFKAIFTQAEIYKSMKNYKNALQSCNIIIKVLTKKYDIYHHIHIINSQTKHAICIQNREHVD